MYDKNDIYNLLIESKYLPEGRYNHSTWELLTHGASDYQEVSVASIHESMHHVLNNTTLFGLLLIITAFLAREQEQYKSQLGELVNNSRNAHEIFATYSSLLLVSPDIATENWMQKRYHHSYVEYVIEAKQIVAGIVSPHHQLVTLNAVMRLCFQSEKLADAINNGTPFDIPFEDYPDNRLKYIQQSITPEYWLSIEHDYLNQNKNDLVIQIYMQIDGPETIEEKYGIHVLNKISVGYEDFIYSIVNANILQSRFSALASNDHLKHLPKLLDFAQHIIPRKLSISPPKLNTQPEVDFGLSEFENESMKIRSNMFPAHILYFSNIPLEGWIDLQFNYEGIKHIYIVSRITEKFVYQFQLSSEDKELLLKTHPDFVTAILCKQCIDKKDSLTVVILNDPLQIEKLSSSNMLILSNLSLSLLADNKWDAWYEVLQKNTTYTLLFDLKPSTQIDRIAMQYEVIEYAKYNLELQSSSYTFICLIAKGTSSSLGMYFLPCSEMMANILIEFLRDKSFTKAYNEKEEENTLNIVLRFGMSHLIDESIFDFRSLDTNYALRCFSQNRF